MVALMQITIYPVQKEGTVCFLEMDGRLLGMGNCFVSPLLWSTRPRLEREDSLSDGDDICVVT